jgi:hypothetical protein
MEKTIIRVYLALAIALFFGCSNPNKENETMPPLVKASSVESDNEPEASSVSTGSPVNVPNSPGDLLPGVDTTKIKTFGDYENQKMVLWNAYEEVKMIAWGQHEYEKAKAWSAYESKKDSAISIIRNTNKGIYLQWLDAKEMHDFATQQKIEHSSDFAIYREMDKHYDSFKFIDMKSYQEFKDLDHNAYTEYKQKEAIAYSAYKSR